jgi:uncharacterized protein YejL (UPF0352 family)
MDSMGDKSKAVDDLSGLPSQELQSAVLKANIEAEQHAVLARAVAGDGEARKEYFKRTLGEDPLVSRDTSAANRAFDKDKEMFANLLTQHSQVVRDAVYSVEITDSNPIKKLEEQGKFFDQVLKHYDLRDLGLGGIVSDTTNEQVGPLQGKAVPLEDSKNPASSR